MTDTERHLWRALRLHNLAGHKFRRQYPLGPYIVDFVCLPTRLIVELDGGQHLNSEEDRVRDAWLVARGFRVLRFWNDEVLLNTQGVLETILAALLADHPHPNPSPIKGEGLAGAAGLSLSTIKEEGLTGTARMSPSPLMGGEGGNSESTALRPRSRLAMQGQPAAGRGGGETDDSPKGNTP